MKIKLGRDFLNTEEYLKIKDKYTSIIKDALNKNKKEIIFEKGKEIEFQMMKKNAIIALLDEQYLDYSYTVELETYDDFELLKCYLLTKEEIKDVETVFKTKDKQRNHIILHGLPTDIVPYIKLIPSLYKTYFNVKVNINNKQFFIYKGIDSKLVEIEQENIYLYDTVISIE